MKLSAAFLATLLLTLPLLTACNTPAGGETGTDTAAVSSTGTAADTSAVTDTAEHEHMFIEWDRNAETHWQVCGCGEPMTDPAEHTLDDDGFCSECGTTVEFSDDGSTYVYTANSNGDIYKYSSYDPDAAVRYEVYSIFSMDEDGNFFESYSHTVDNEGGYEYECTYNEYEDILTRVLTDANENTTDYDRWEYEYNEDGQPLWEKQYRNDVLIYEIPSYAEWEDDSMYMRYPETVIDYREDGTRLVTAYGDYGMTDSETEYAADDTVLTVITYQYEFDADGNVLHLQVFTDGTLTRDEVYAYDENGWTYLSVSTEYLEDGSYRVTTYYADGESDYVLYNADGAVIEES